MNAILFTGAALVGLPILLHLIMKQEPKRLPFPALRFLKQKQKTNQRKLRLRHFLLLALRMLLIALFCLTLYQPTLILSEGLNLAAEQPVDAVFIIDTSPSMGYRIGDRSRLDDAKARALTLLNDLPANSRVAIIDPGDPEALLPAWEPSLASARERLEQLGETQAAAQPLTAGLAAAYRLLGCPEEEPESATASPRLVVIFSDRTAASWESSRGNDLKALQARLPQPPPLANLFVDVGVDTPANVAITSVSVTPQQIPAQQPVNLTVTIQSTGVDVPSGAVQCRLLGNQPPQVRPFQLTAGTPQAVTFTFNDLPIGFHQAEIRLETPDALLIDNRRFLTFRVGESRPVLTIADQPDDAIYWKLAHQTKGEFEIVIRTPEQASVPEFGLNRYEAVVLLSVAEPSPLLWEKLSTYVNQGGQLLIIPGGPEQLRVSAYDPGRNAAAAALMPGKLASVIDVSTERPAGVEWLLDERSMRHPLLAPFKAWRLRGNVDFLKNPRRVWTYWRVEAAPDAVVVRYDWPAEPQQRDPAILERTVGRGRVLMLTTRMDSPWEPRRRWHNYWETAGSSWAVVFPNLVLTYLAGDTSQANLNFQAGSPVLVPLQTTAPTGTAAPKLLLEGPGISGTDATPEIDPGQRELRLSGSQTRNPGNYVLRTESGDWRTAFSLNLPAEESDLSRIPDEIITEILGPAAIIPATRELAFREALELKFDQPVDLFPWLLLAVLFLFSLEGLVANRFYPAPRADTGRSLASARS